MRAIVDRGEDVRRNTIGTPLSLNLQDRPSQSWNGFVLKKLPLCGADEHSPEASVYFEWPTIADFKRILSNMGETIDYRTLAISRIESTSYAVVQSLRITLANGAKSPQFGKYKPFNSEWYAPHNAEGDQIK